MANGIFETDEEADLFVKGLKESEQALVYRALYLNGLRIDRAEKIIREHEEGKRRARHEAGR